MSKAAGVDMSRIFEQYLNTIKIPVLEYRIAGDEVSFRWTNSVDGFDMPVDVSASSGTQRVVRLKPTTSWSTMRMPVPAGDSLVIRPDFYVQGKRVPLTP